MCVNVQVAPRRNRQIEHSMPRKRRQHMVEKPDTRLNTRLPRPIEAKL
jgi:hypothetical protein